MGRCVVELSGLLALSLLSKTLKYDKELLGGRRGPIHAPSRLEGAQQARFAKPS